MAEASVASTDGRFYCHVCNEDINPVLPEYTCPSCHGGFIEQRDAEPAAIADDPDDELPPANDPTLRAVTQMLNMVPFQALGLDRSIIVGGAPAHRGGHQHAHVHHHPMQHQHGFLGDLLDNLFASFPNVRVNVDTSGEAPIHFQLHGNPGDYAWGNVELDRIVTHLLNQLDTSGPPPLATELIQRLPTVAVTQQSVDDNLQCMVCFEDYVLDEKVRELPCSHLFHTNCIVPWLELHGTCPVCRTSVDAAGGSAAPPQPPPPSASPPDAPC